jgi:hypothetical protein
MPASCQLSLAGRPLDDRPLVDLDVEERGELAVIRT